MTHHEISDKLRAIVTPYFRLDEGEIKPDTHLINDLGADSIALVELGFRISETFGIPMLEADESLLVFDKMVERIHGEMEKQALAPTV